MTYNFILISYIIFITTYTLTSLLCYYYDIYDNNYRDKRLEIQSKQELINAYNKYLPTVAFNAIIVTGICVFCHHYFLTYFNPTLLIYQPLSTIRLIHIIQYIIAYITADAMFYSFHRLSHIPWLYEYGGHGKHHEVKHPIGLAGLYTTPFDLIFSNYIPVGLTVGLIITHPYMFFIWVLCSTYNLVMVSHSGYDIAKFHDLHHQKGGGCNYSITSLTDILMGTYQTN